MIEDLENQVIYTCRFCNPPERNRILFESENFYILLSLGPIVEGYCLLVSKQHISCCGAIPLELKEEFRALYYKLKDILVETYGSCICYEHGRAGSCMVQLEGNKHCYHAHMHFAPIATDLNKIVQKYFDEKRLNALDDFFVAYKAMQRPPYLFIDDIEQGMHIYRIDQKIRRQYLRFEVAKSINKEYLWDWVTYQGWDEIHSAYNVLSPKFKDLKL